MSLQNREILLGLSGGVACYKTADLASRLVQAGAGVSVVMTSAAQRFIGRTTFEALTNRPVHTELFAPQEHPLGEHIGLARRAELLVIAPATASLMGCMAHGLAPDLLTTLTLTVACPVLLAPAMNNEMWVKPAVQRNVQQLVDDGVHFIGPGDGWLSCGAVGPGRMAEPDAILQKIAGLLASNPDRVSC